MFLVKRGLARVSDPFQASNPAILCPLHEVKVVLLVRLG